MIQCSAYMDGDSKLLFSYIPLATIVFLTAMLVYQHQHNKVVEDLRSQLKTAKVEATQAPAATTSESSPTPAVTDKTDTSESPTVNPPEVQQAPAQSQTTDSVQADRVQQIDNQVSTLQARLGSLQRDMQSIDDRASAFQKQEYAGVQQQRVNIDQQMAAIIQALNDVDAKLKTMTENANTAPPEVPLRNLRAQRVELQNQLAQLGVQKSQATSTTATTDAQTSGQVVAEKDRLRREEDDIKGQISRLQAERNELTKKQTETRTLQAQ